MHASICIIITILQAPIFPPEQSWIRQPRACNLGHDNRMRAILDTITPHVRVCSHMMKSILSGAELCAN